MRVLWLSRWFPYPPDNGSRIRIFNIVKQLSARNEVALIAFAEQPVPREWLELMRQHCRRVEIVRYRPFRPGHLKAIGGFVSLRPRAFVDTDSAEMRQLIARLAAAETFDCVIASQIDMLPYAAALPCAIKIAEEIELAGLYEQFAHQRHPLKWLRGGLMWWKLSRYLAGLLRAFDSCTVVSEQERSLLRTVAPGCRSISVVPNGVDTSLADAAIGPPRADTLIYAGALTYGANFDAVAYFLREIYPRIRAKRPNVQLSITGALAGVPLERLATGAGVSFTGYLDTVGPAVAQSWASIVPLRHGGGTRLKILESLALGTPVVTTGKGVEGLELIPGRDLLVADDPSDFAAAVVRLLEDAELRQSLSRNGRQAVVDRYDWRNLGQQLDHLLEELATQSRRSATASETVQLT